MEYCTRAETRWYPSKCHTDIHSAGKEWVDRGPGQLGMKEGEPVN